MSISAISHTISNGVRFILSNIFKIIGIILLLWFIKIGHKIYKRVNADKIRKKQEELQRAKQLRTEELRNKYPKIAQFSDTANKTITIAGQEIKKELLDLHEKAKRFEERRMERERLSKLKLENQNGNPTKKE